MNENTSTAVAVDQAWLEARLLEIRGELIVESDEVFALMAKAGSSAGLTDLSDFERALIGMCLCYVTTALLLPEPSIPPTVPSLEPSDN